MAKEIYITKNGELTVYQYENAARESVPRSLKEGHQKERAKIILDEVGSKYIGKRTFSHKDFEGRVAEFSKDSFNENLRYGSLFDGKADVLTHLDDYLTQDLSFRYEDSLHGRNKGFYKAITQYKGELKDFKGRNVELQFAIKPDWKLYFYFIKFL